MPRCIVCRNEQGAHTRSVERSYGGDGGEMTIRLGYCADRAECGEATAVNLIELLAAPFIAADVRRDGVSSIEDLAEADR
jgi:hypothetical protein